MFRTFLARLFPTTFANPSEYLSNGRTRRTRASHRARLAVTALEAREVPTTLTIAALSNGKEGDSDASVRLTRDNTSGTLQAMVSFGGTATADGDYTAPTSALVSFADGVATADLVFEVLDDDLSEPPDTPEPTESITVTVVSGMDPYDIGNPSSATVYILDNDTPKVSVTATDTVEGGATGGFTFTRIGDLSSSLTVNYTVGGTATSVTDYASIGTSVVFAANSDRVEVGVEAFGDNMVDDNETVALTISTNSNYTIDSSAGAATVTIADQPLTVSVTWLADGEEGGSNGSFQVTRYGDLSSSLTVSYTVTGTALSGTDFTALSGSVTFAATAHTETVTVTVTNDAGAEATETVTLTLAEDDDYVLGNDSDTIFIKDNETTRVTWQGDDTINPTDWTDADNWSTGVVPTSGQDVYFNGSTSNVNCTNVGSGLSDLYGLHIIGAYSGTLTLANALSVGTFEQLSGTLNQPSARHLTITDAMLWSGGTLNSSATSANVNVDDAAGRINPPDAGSMAIASTLRVVNGAVVTILGGTIDFTGGNGMYIDAKVDLKTTSNVEITLANVGGDKRVEIASNGKLRLLKTDKEYAAATSALPFVNAGELWVGAGLILDVKGHAEGGNTQSIKQTGGKTTLSHSSSISTEFGMWVTGGDLIIVGGVKNGLQAKILGNLTLDGTDAKTVQFMTLGLTPVYVQFYVIGDVNWDRGTFKPRVNGDTGIGNLGSSDVWIAKFTFTIGANVVLEPICPNMVDVDPGNFWQILYGHDGIKGNAPALPATGWTNFSTQLVESPNSKLKYLQINR